MNRMDFWGLEIPLHWLLNAPLSFRLTTDRSNSWLCKYWEIGNCTKTQLLSVTAFLDPACISLTWPMITRQTAPCKQNGHLLRKILLHMIYFFIHSVLSLIFLHNPTIVEKTLCCGDIPWKSIGQSKKKLPNKLILSSSQKVGLVPPIHVPTTKYLLQSSSQ